jgi:GT2 family glycosyltransferase
VTEPIVTVVVPHYNDPAGLAACLDALEQQTLSRDRYRIVVGDNMSPQGPEAIRAVTRDRAELVLVPERGAGPARNAAAAIATTAFLAFTDSDCVPEPGWLEAGLRALQDADFVGGRMTVSVDDESRMTGAEAFERIFGFKNRDYVEQKGFTVTANLFCPRALFEAVGGFRNGVSEDLEWCQRARAAGYRIGYAEGAVASHPARRDWRALKLKWERVQRESAALAFAEPAGKLRWLARTWLLPASIVAHLLQVIASRDVPAAAKPKAAWTLARLRLWRFLDGHRLLVRR